MSDALFQYQSGDKPPPGTYACLLCEVDTKGFIVPEMGKVLPDCPDCGKTDWYKV